MNKSNYFIVSNLQTRILDSARTVCGKEWANNGRDLFNDPFARLYWIEKGEGEINFLSAGRFELKPGWLYVIPPHSPARYRAIGEMVLYWLHFRADIFMVLDFFKLLKPQLCIKLEDKDEINKDFWIKLLKFSKGQHLSDLLKADIMLRQMLTIFVKNLSNENYMLVDSLKRIEPILDFISKNINKKISLFELVELLPMSKAYFSSFFSKSVGMSPVKFINRMKIERAQFLLLQGKLSIKEVAIELGFEDVYYFSRVFKRIVGLSPKHYIEQERLREKNIF
ncbi:MAG TPA: helix-turn-helix domain-containing protein [Victivallales bacterium]|nr:helix-turn-helix domain-containing protein [Victivallales bacterium]HPO90399.1 helix-turn-helix domain-containing protein [Victivallales bacterium]HRR28063.1 helix-turn-helix domain-containing protein [Victivallales bacterium]